MRLVCLPSDSSVDLEVQVSSEAPLGFFSAPPLPDCDSVCEGGAEVLGACWQDRSSGLVSEGFGAGVCAHRPGGTHTRRKTITVGEEDNYSSRPPAQRQITSQADAVISGRQAHNSEWFYPLIHNRCFSALRRHLPTNPAASRRSAAKSTPATCSKRCISRVGTNGFKTMSHNAT